GRARLCPLERVRMPYHGAGACRSALAVGADGVLLGPGCADPLYRRALRVSMGGALVTPAATVPDWAEGLAGLRAAGFTIVALTPDRAAVDLTALGAAPGRLVSLLGAEGGGL